MNSAVRKIIAIIAAVVFIFSVSMVLREHFRSNASAQITENMVQSAVSFREKEVFGDSKDEIIAEDDVSDKFVVDFADPLLVRTIRIAKEHFCTCSAI